MTATTQEAAPERAARSLDPTGAQIWRAFRLPLLIALVIVLVGGVLGYFGSRQRQGLLDPEAVDGGGSRALARLLKHQGVKVEVVRTADQALARAGDDTTLLVAFPDLVPQDTRARLGRDAATVVLIEPGNRALAGLAPDVSAVGQAFVEDRDPDCALPAARAAGQALMGGLLYDVSAKAEGRAELCYREKGHGSLVRLTEGDRELVVLGTPQPLVNRHLAEEGNAALALRLLGQHPRLVWYVPSVAEGGGTATSLYDLLPAGWRWAAVQLWIAVALLALWRVRRLGPVVTEPLPVVVRAAETVEGRARLYRRAHAREHAAATLRAATLSRIVPLLGLPREPAPAAVVAAVARRTGRPPHLVAALLYGAGQHGGKTETLPTELIPADWEALGVPAEGRRRARTARSLDEVLVRLADGLDNLEKEVRRS
ncbi:DUF4350 domain-containing protein [Carbonactinospora thermoautotrophica]|uniref:DUF4350 domain-containing protein n=2 Tax=Carbonactinospora thermoautotrophica TaxID=1469144 RepID=UPI00226FC89E|nr:DUF4350 domain-containing protein [Carbonactinospora thermoautotrophica]MCX9190207.1 DUF4350 domain-containing protein [Carbonactinospora thermoautotrophica]